MTKFFSDYKDDAHNWITLTSGEYYPDILVDACELYKPILVYFAQLLRTSNSSADLLENISALKEQWTRIQLARVFRKYISPELPVEMLKKKTQIKDIIQKFGKGFRPINQVQKHLRADQYPTK